MKVDQFHHTARENPTVGFINNVVDLVWFDETKHRWAHILLDLPLFFFFSSCCSLPGLCIRWWLRSTWLSGYIMCRAAVSSSLRRVETIVHCLLCSVFKWFGSGLCWLRMARPILCNGWISSCSHRVRIALNLKGDFVLLDTLIDAGAKLCLLATSSSFSVTDILLLSYVGMTVGLELLMLRSNSKFHREKYEQLNLTNPRISCAEDQQH
jgi:hypothetical protein